MPWCYGLRWDDIELMEEDGKLLMERVAELLDVLLHKEPRLPTAEEIVSFHMHANVDAGEQPLQRRRRRLVWLLRTAENLGEDLACWL